jgi:hypothetical protein
MFILLCQKRSDPVLVLEGFIPQGADPPPLPLRVAKAGGNHLNGGIIPPLPTGIGER